MHLEEICSAAFDFPIHLKKLSNSTVLELFHGPTSAFKDFGARFLAFSMEKLLVRHDRKLCILVATSGDTGGAVAAAFHNRKNLSVKVLFPKGRVAKRQKRQLTCWDGNISSYEVEGSFDDCQKMVKDAFVDPQYSAGLSSANSINLGRLLPQMVYYVYASMVYEKENGKKPVIVIPSGNVGNSTGAYWAMSMGAPIERIVLAVNANRTIPDYLESGEYRPRPSVKTLANANDEIRETIRKVYTQDGYIMCPHTACGERVRQRLLDGKDNVLLVSTAHPAKFETIVEPLIGTEVPLPPALKSLLDRPVSYKEIPADYHRLFD